MSTSAASIVTTPEIVVRYIEVADQINQIQAVWPALEDVVGALRGRRFLAAFDPTRGWYRACVEIRDDVSSAERELPEMVVPGGRFGRIRLRGEPPEVYDQIAAAYAVLEAWAERDDSRPSLERYRRRDEIDILMPVT